MKGRLTLIFCLLYFSCTDNRSDVYKEEGLKEINGTQLYYKILGQGEPILVIHGGPGLNHKYLLPHLKDLSDRYQMIFYDQRACGNSSLDVDTASIFLDNFTRDINEIRKVFETGKINLMAHSWGGLLALQYVIKYPEYVKSLILINSVGASSALNTEANRILAERFTKEDSLERVKIMQKDAFREGDPRTFEQLMKIGFKYQFHNPLLIDSLDLSLNKDYARTSQLLQHLAKDLTVYDFHPDLSSIQSPTLLIYGSYDPLTDLAGERIHGSIENSLLVVLNNCGHFPFMEKQKEFMDTIINFIRTNY